MPKARNRFENVFTSLSSLGAETTCLSRNCTCAKWVVRDMSDEFSCSCSCSRSCKREVSLNILQNYIFKLVAIGRRVFLLIIIIFSRIFTQIHFRMATLMLQAALVVLWAARRPTWPPPAFLPSCLCVALLCRDYFCSAKTTKWKWQQQQNIYFLFNLKFLI